MSILKSKLISGAVAEPQKFVIYGPQGVGKSTLAMQFPKPLFLDTEKGSRRLAVDRVPITSLVEFNDIIKDPSLSDYQTVVVDTIDWLESQVADALCKEYKQESIESADKNSPFSYGKGVVKLGERMTRLMLDLDTLVGRGCNVVLLGHSIVRKVDMPDTSGSYDRYELDLNAKHVAPIIKHWCDALLFFNFRIITREADAGFGKTKVEAVKVRERLLFCNHTAAADAKNRHGMADEEKAEIATIQKAFANVGAPWGGAAKQIPATADGAQGEPATVNNGSGQAAAMRAHETKPGPETPPQTDGIPGLPPENGGPSVDQFLVVLKGHEDKALSWLRARGRITAQQFLKDTPEDTRKKVLANPAKFIEVISNAKEAA